MRLKNILKEIQKVFGGSHYIKHHKTPRRGDIPAKVSYKICYASNDKVDFAITTEGDGWVTIMFTKYGVYKVMSDMVPMCLEEYYDTAWTCVLPDWMKPDRPCAGSATMIQHEE